jgi:chromosome segregation ATPase
MQESESSLKHKTEMVTRLEAKSSAMCETIKSFESKLVCVESDKRAAEETTRKLGRQLVEKDLQVTTCQSDLKLEREWRQSLQESMVKDRDRISEMDQQVMRLTKISHDYNSLQKAYKELENTCEDYERSMEELGVHLYESKLKVDDLKEATGVSKAAHWSKDKEVSKCMGCEKEFSLSRRRVSCQKNFQFSNGIVENLHIFFEKNFLFFSNF